MKCMNADIVDGLVHAVEEILAEDDPTVAAVGAGVPQQIAAATVAGVAGGPAARL